jgi:hypothetical protein
MSENLRESSNLVNDVFNIIDNMNISENLDEDLLNDILVHCSKNTEESRYKLLAYVNQRVSELGLEGRDDLIVHLYQLYQEEYGPIQHNHIQLEIKQQLDSLAINSEPKDNLINLVLNEYLKNYGITAFLIVGNKYLASPETESIKGSRFFLPISVTEPRLHPLIHSIFHQIQEKIQSNSNLERMFFIIRQQDHYMVLDYNTSMRQCIIMDAAGDARQLNFLHLYAHVPAIENIIYIKNERYIANEVIKNTSLQKDKICCSIFALDHVLSAGLFPDLHRHFNEIKLDESPNIGYISWFQAPPELVRNAQSPTFRAKYVESRPEACEYLADNNFKKTISTIKQIVNNNLSTLDDTEPSSMNHHKL